MFEKIKFKGLFMELTILIINVIQVLIFVMYLQTNFKNNANNAVNDTSKDHTIQTAGHSIK